MISRARGRAQEGVTHAGVRLRNYAAGVRSRHARRGGWFVSHRTSCRPSRASNAGARSAGARSAVATARRGSRACIVATNRRGSNRRWMKVQWQVRLDFGSFW